MRRITWTAAVLLCFSLVLAACGTKDAESVVKDLDKHVSNMESYQGSGTMTLRTGQQPLEYKVEVSYQKPQYYRIKLTNEEKDITQIVLRNDDGVFVLTPKLNKVFRFQSDWPQNQGQVYLYQTLVQSILVDNSRQFVVDEDAYVFDVMANYNNGSLARQKIWLNKSELKPVKVEVSDSNAAVMVEVVFNDFKFGPKFEKAVFETEANMKAEPSSQPSESDEPTMGVPEQEGDDAANDTGDNAAAPGDDAVAPGDDSVAPGDDAAAPGDDAAAPDDDATADGDDQVDKGTDENTGTDANGDASAGTGEDAAAEFTVMVPSHTPEGVVQQDLVDIVFGGNPGHMIRYTGEYNYTLIQTEPKDVAASFSEGTMVDLGFTIGMLSGGEDQKTLTWTYEGHQFRLTTENLPEAEMLKVAQSVQGEIGK